MAQWAVIIPAEQWATERLFHNEVVTVAGAAGAVAPDEEVLLVADDQVVALGRAAKTEGDDLTLTYLRRQFDAPLPAEGLGGARPVEVEPETFRRLAAQLRGESAAGLPTWLVSVAMPIEAATPAEAVRQFWSHVRELGPAELPTYVWPTGDELSMLAFVLGAEANQDPEEDEDE
ncbi:hypothetical protein [Paractinoplanes toevensis]|uniref:Uncharacterized protein n=1 Tax=Paractinoplanes toevensis TaxID=571911 RepID=A0A919W9B1_9ACTN|nr:hypothetical protein [Actinoplanes toevensis]GIM95996.1 hypothetical protein Ato02nite_077890 [Actinoplanes toevensis]